MVNIFNNFYYITLCLTSFNFYEFLSPSFCFVDHATVLYIGEESDDQKGLWLYMV